MSLIIKGMNMPERLPDLADTNAITIYNCQIFIDSKGNASIRIRGHREEYHVVKISTPHGRLIDADELEKCVHEWYDVGEYIFADTIRNADTIIEAEKNDEK